MAYHESLSRIIAGQLYSLSRADSHPGAANTAAARREFLDYIARHVLPHGAGIDSGCEFDLDRCKPEKIVITLGFHHMNQHGYYDGWTQHSVIVTPSLISEFDIRITGRNRNGIKDYLADIFRWELARHYVTSWDSETGAYGIAPYIELEPGAAAPAASLDTEPGAAAPAA